MGIAFSSMPRLLRKPQGVLQLPSTRTPTLHLPNDLVLDILSRIPAKSLCRFRCVSKGWHALISDTIVTVYRSRDEPLLVVGSNRDESLRLIDMGGNPVKVIRNVGPVSRLICTSRDSLVCVLGFSFGVSCDVKVIDLASGEVLQVQTCRKTCLLGFGRASPSGAYKMVVCIDPSTCEILTVGDGVGWRRMQQPPPTADISYTSNPVVVNGLLHLMLKSPLDGKSVLCFNLASEEWTKGIKGPADVELHQREPSLSELNGSLCMVQTEAQGYATNIWLLTSNYNKNTWVKVYVIPLDSSPYVRLIPLRMLRDGERLLFCNTWKNSDFSSLQIYDVHSWEFTDAPNALAGVQCTNFSTCS
ncbi:hypothetical protein ACQ4PT_036999 [Festuca glaucescens]